MDTVRAPERAGARPGRHLLVIVTLVLGLLASLPAAPSDAARPGLDGPVVATGPARVVAPSARPTERRHGRSPVHRMLELVNVIRSVPHRCGTTWLPAAEPLHRNKRLERAATRYARTMARRDWFDHEAPDGTDPGSRISAAGYRWSRWGENIAAGYDGVAQTLAAWLASPGHCRNLMGDYRQVGFGDAYSRSSTYGHYWVQDFASPR